jgi:hypothetical protein
VQVTNVLSGFSGAQNKVVDETPETPHNLISLLLTNKTLCRQAPDGKTPVQTGSLKINSR